MTELFLWNETRRLLGKYIGDVKTGFNHWLNTVIVDRMDPRLIPLLQTLHFFLQPAMQFCIIDKTESVRFKKLAHYISYFYEKSGYYHDLGAVYMSPVCRDETLAGLKIKKRNLLENMLTCKV